MKRIVLHGALAEHVPEAYRDHLYFDFNSAREAVSAIEANWPGFQNLIRLQQLYVFTDEDKPIDEDKVNWNLNTKELHFMPAIEGSGGRRGLKAILGLALIAVSFGLGGFVAGGLSSTVTVGGVGLGITGTTLLTLGAGMVLQALVQPPKPPAPRDDRVDSSFYQGPLNTQNEGDIMPYVAGQNVIVGGVVIATDIVVENRI